MDSKVSGRILQRKLCLWDASIKVCFDFLLNIICSSFRASSSSEGFETPQFLAVDSCFSNFVEGAQLKLQAVLDAAQTVADTGDSPATLADLLEKLRSADPLSSTITLREIWCELRSLSKTCDGNEVDDLFRNMEEFVNFVSSHEVHLLFAALRAPDVPSFFILNLCKINYRSWCDFAGKSVLFGAVLKAAWARFLSKAHSSMGKDHKVFKAFLCDSQKSPDLKSFTEHFQHVHFNQVFFFLRYFAFNHCAPYLFRHRAFPPYLFRTCTGLP